MIEKSQELYAIPASADEILRKTDILHNLAKELLKYETLDSKDLEKILKGKLTRPLNENFKDQVKKKAKKKQSNGSI